MTIQRTILITGAASGIGARLAEDLTQAGWRVVAADLAAERLEALAVRLDRQGGAVVPMVVDVACPDSVADLFARLKRVAGHLDAAVNGAGLEGRVALLKDQEPADLLRTIAVNAAGTLLCLKQEMAMMTAQGAGTIVNITSIYGLGGQPRWAPYCGTKHFVIGATRAAALEGAQSGVRVNAVAPGPIATPLLERATGGDPERTASMVPMRRNGHPGEVTAAIRWLLSDEASFVTGAVLPVDGGMSAQVSTIPTFA